MWAMLVNKTKAFFLPGAILYHHSQSSRCRVWRRRSSSKDKFDKCAQEEKWIINNLSAWISLITIISTTSGYHQRTIDFYIFCIHDILLHNCVYVYPCLGKENQSILSIYIVYTVHIYLDHNSSLASRSIRIDLLRHLFGISRINMAVCTLLAIAVLLQNESFCAHFPLP